MNNEVVINGWVAKESQFREVEVSCLDGVITEIAEIGHLSDNSPLRILTPGFIDVHNHGAVGIDVNAADADDLITVGRFLASRGVTGWLPTLVPDSEENYVRLINAVDQVMSIQDKEPTAQILGVHYEGIFANEHMCGALHTEHFRSFIDGSELTSLPLPGRGVRMMTFAPEIEGGLELLKRLVDNGWIASIGHTGATAELLDRAFESGARHLTHFFNAMTGLHHRDQGVVGWALTRDGVTFDIIADGIHVHPKMLEFAIRSKGIDNVSMISDSIAPTGFGDGEFEVWGESISVTNGRTSNKQGAIAGSVIAVNEAFSLLNSIGFSMSDINRMAAQNPAKLLGLDSTIGTLEVGKRADIVVINPDAKIVEVYVGGKGVRIDD